MLSGLSLWYSAGRSYCLVRKLCRTCRTCHYDQVRILRHQGNSAIEQYATSAQEYQKHYLLCAWHYQFVLPVSSLIWPNKILYHKGMPHPQLYYVEVHYLEGNRVDLGISSSPLTICWPNLDALTIDSSDWLP